VLAHRGQVRSPRDESNIASASGQPRAKIPTDASGADNCDSHPHSLAFPYSTPVVLRFFYNTVKPILD
jgi:hypothetical protein